MKNRSKTTSFGEKHILHFDISMRDSMLVKEVDAVQQLSEELPGESGGKNSHFGL